jgi:hypothetical protein
LTHAPPAPPPTVAAITRQIVCRLAQRAGRDSSELERELCLAGPDLPVEVDEMRAILSALERDFGVALADNEALRPRLDYVRELALYIQAQMLETARRASARILDAAGSVDAGG